MSVQNSTTDLAISITQAEAKAEATKIYNDVEAEVRDISIGTQARAYAEVTKLTGLSPANDLN